MILWALEKKSVNGVRLLRENPLLGTAKRLRVRPNKTPAQPLITHETYLKLLKASKKLPQYVGAFLVIAEGTGRRLSAIRNLTRGDVSLDDGTLLWRADNDKMGLEMERVAPA